MNTSYLHNKAIPNWKVVINQAIPRQLRQAKTNIYWKIAFSYSVININYLSEIIYSVRSAQNYKFKIYWKFKPRDIYVNEIFWGMQNEHGSKKIERVGLG